jgi:hypothetical protein
MATLFSGLYASFAVELSNYRIRDALSALIAETRSIPDPSRAACGTGKRIMPHVKYSFHLHPS